MSISPLSAGGPNASSLAATDNPSIDTLVFAVMLERHDMLKGVIEERAKSAQTLNEQLRSLSREKAEIAGKGIPSEADKERLNALDAQINSVISLQRTEMLTLQDLTSKLNESLERMAALVRKGRNEGA